ncbi:fam-c protein [Plasmodium yoelii]|uniref:Fam-c protein n=3 Tax=Plasmodium yoelii TaxID=5861 RepID=A0AAE9WP55_PLAYO|nr:fam-c protein [Plasmodium yoelii]EAA19068.1 hypothetical protein [Plasmodium yoelii yoelii]WBY56165.1 fam-c protein [Plasmodium yoelii yoelii]CDS44339.1 fam-c protein [Plasmodium yoelii]VTZ75630.1 fam-c protein [Plasmodium yoelii]|eukprot:XP_727503.1 fam-c protein [Plasmodium yoelii]
MNKRIFSLVCIALYTLLTVPAHCSEQEVSDVGNKSDEKNDIEYKRETQLKNTNSKDDRGFNCFNIFKKNKRTQSHSYSKVPLTHPYNKITETSSNNNDSIHKIELLMEKIARYFLANHSEILKFLSNNKITEASSNNNDAIHKVSLEMRKIMRELLEKSPEGLKLLSRLAEKLEKRPSNDKPSE